VPTPYSVDSTQTSLPVWTVDDSGNTQQSGGLMLATRPTPTPTPAGYVQLYSPDGTVLKTITPSGTTATVPTTNAAGDLTVTGLLTVSPGGTIALGGGVNLYANASNLQTDNFFVMPNGQATGSFSVFGNAAGSLTLGTLGGGIAIKEGANGRMGVSTLVGGTVTVANTSVTANTVIMALCQTPGGTPGFLRVSARVASTSFTLLSSSGTDTSVVGWVMFEPA
jgi:hypothetical protein